jgi:hypothetical protein
MSLWWSHREIKLDATYMVQSRIYSFGHTWAPAYLFKTVKKLQKMKNFKQIALGLMVGAMAIGFSAFTNAKRDVKIITYYKTIPTTPASDPTSYKFYNGDRCLPSGVLCTAQWDIGSNPTPTVDGTALPASGVTFQVGTETDGHFQ